jgi:hypothetical protein
MTNLLLIGAGFSYNWGGPLAADVFSNLLSDKDIDEHTRRLLLDADGKGGFEKVLADLEVSADPDDKKRHGAMISALAGMFNFLNGSFLQLKQFEFENPPDTRYSLHSFLNRFDAIFGLNQDALLEIHYLPLVMSSRWGRAHLPGLKYLGNFQPTGGLHDRIAVMEPNPSDFKLAPGVQPYIKLHGSANWNDGGFGGRVLIMGGAKSANIDRFAILKWYHKEFREMLMRPDARLMVIGYSFGDEHINDAILEGLNRGLKLFLVDPNGHRVLDADKRFEPFKHQLIGISRKPLTETFGGNRPENSTLSRFFDR